MSRRNEKKKNPSSEKKSYSEKHTFEASNWHPVETTLFLTVTNKTSMSQVRQEKRASVIPKDGGGGGGERLEKSSKDEENPFGQVKLR